MRGRVFLAGLLFCSPTSAADVGFTGTANPTCYSKGGEGTIKVKATNTLGHQTDALVLAACGAFEGSTQRPTWIVEKTSQDASDPLKLSTVFTYEFNNQNCIRANPSAPGGSWPVNATETVTFTYRVPSALPATAGAPAAEQPKPLVLHYTAWSQEAPVDKETKLAQCSSQPKKPKLEVIKFRRETGFYPNNQLVGYSIVIRNIGDAPTAGDITVTDVIPSKWKIKGAYLGYWDFNQRLPVVPQGQTVTARFTNSLPPAKDNPIGGPDFASARLEIWIEPKAGATGDYDNTASVCGGGDETAPCSNPRESNTEKGVLKAPTGPPPEAKISGPGASQAGNTVTYSAGSAGVAAAAAASDPATYAWMLSDVGLTPAATGSTLVHTFARPGKVNVSLIAFANGARATADLAVNVAPPKPGCTPSATALCLLGGRFEVSVDWQALPNAASGAGQTRSITSDTGAFWFFAPANLELIVKLIDGRGLNGKFWVFFGALTNVQYQIKVRDTVTNEVRQYDNPQGNLTSFADTGAFPRAGNDVAVEFEDAAAPISEHENNNASEPLASCIADPGTKKLCLSERFDVSVTCSAPGTACTPNPVKLTTDTGYFWFFNSANIELMTKVVDGRGLNGKFWFFYGALSDVQYQIHLSDRVTGAVKDYANAQGHLGSVADTSALPGQ